MQAEGAARQIVADATGQPVEKIGQDTSMFTMPGWDSVAHMNIVLATEALMGQMLSPDQIVSVMSVADLTGLIRDVKGAS